MVDKREHALTYHDGKMLEIIQHEEKNSLSCDLCDTQFAQKRNLSRHVKAVHEKITSFCCSICNKAFASKQILGRHVQSVHENTMPFCCSICNKAFASKQMLERHFATNHKQHIEHPDKKIEKQCNVCLLKVARTDSLKRHISQVHDGIKSVLDDDIKKRGKS